MPSQHLVQLPNIDGIIEGLYDSYKNDSEHFIPKSIDGFIEREHGFIEERLLRELFFPRDWNHSYIAENKQEIEQRINNLYGLLFKGINSYTANEENSQKIAYDVLDKLPNIRETLKKDVEASYKGDPAAKSYTEIIRTYPGFRTILAQRVAHELYKSGAKEYARELMEIIHSLTGIDIHPGAKIGEYFFIDHGTGVVIGETAIIGNWVRIYQGVRLGAISLPIEKVETLRKGVEQRHPTVEDNVILYDGAILLGGKTVIRRGSVIGANAFITYSIPPNVVVPANSRITSVNDCQLLKPINSTRIPNGYN